MKAMFKNIVYCKWCKHFRKIEKDYYGICYHRNKPNTAVAVSPYWFCNFSEKRSNDNND